MNKTLKSIATSYTATVFLVIGISGVMMYFKFFDMLVKKLHEDLGLVFTVAAIVHVIANWKAMKNYFNKKTFISACITTILVSGFYVVQSLDEGREHPGKRLSDSVLNAPLALSLPILEMNYEKVSKVLEQNGIEIKDNKSIMSIADSNNVSPFMILELLQGQNEKRNK